MTATLKHYIEKFMRAARQPKVERLGQVPSADTVKLGIALIEEELQELKDAIVKAEIRHDTGACLADGTIDLSTIAEVADALADLLYVVMWNAVAWRIPIVEVLEEVQRSNMTKFSGPTRKDPLTGKVLKPDGWQPPDIWRVLSRAYMVQVRDVQQPTCSRATAKDCHSPEEDESES